MINCINSSSVVVEYIDLDHVTICTMLVSIYDSFFEANVIEYPVVCNVGHC